MYPNTPGTPKRVNVCYCTHNYVIDVFDSGVNLLVEIVFCIISLHHVDQTLHITSQVCVEQMHSILINIELHRSIISFKKCVIKRI